MRLSSEARQVTSATVCEVFGNDAWVRLFSSRLDDDRRGRDIDLLVELPFPEPERQHKSLTCVARLQRRLGDQPIDVLVVDPGMTPSPVQRHTGVPLEFRQAGYVVWRLSPTCIDDGSGRNGW